MIRALAISVLAALSFYVSFRFFWKRPRPEMRRIYPYSVSRWD